MEFNYPSESFDELCIDKLWRNGLLEYKAILDNVRSTDSFEMIIDLLHRKKTAKKELSF